jgi:hypothetical protein
LACIAESWRTSDDGSHDDKLRHDRFARPTLTGFFNTICAAAVAPHRRSATIPFVEGHFMVFWISYAGND